MHNTIWNEWRSSSRSRRRWLEYTKDTLFCIIVIGESKVHNTFLTGHCLVLPADSSQECSTANMKASTRAREFSIHFRHCQWQHIVIIIITIIQYYSVLFNQNREMRFSQFPVVLPSHFHLTILSIFFLSRNTTCMNEVIVYIFLFDEQEKKTCGWRRNYILRTITFSNSRKMAKLK